MTKPTALLVLFAATLATSQAFGANECKVEYGYHTGSGTNRQDKTATENIDAGATETVNRSGMNYVKNLKNNKVRVTLAGAADNDFTLDKNQINPGVGFYLTAVQLKTLKCLAQASAPAFGSPEQMLAALKQANTAASEIAKQLKNTFNLAESQVAALLKGAGYSAAQVAAALKSAFNATGAQVAGWLKAAGYTGEQVAAALKSAFNASAQQAGGWLKTAFSATGAQIADWLQAAGYTG
ncbi:MAG TPA: hypothetical protein VI565_11390, partial [Burkholderiales bacterium]|nr:hypothetical protein [Burkholderiales bacterium]